MCKQDYENKKLVITKFPLFLQTLNSNFHLSANRALALKKWLIKEEFCQFELKNVPNIPQKISQSTVEKI